MLEAAIEAGADDVASSEDGHEVYTAPDALREVAKALEAKFGEPRKAALVWRPQNTVAVDDEQGEKLLKLIEALDEQRRRAERLRQFRGLRRADAQDERVNLVFHRVGARFERKRNPPETRGNAGTAAVEHGSELRYQQCDAIIAAHCSRGLAGSLRVESC